MTRHAANYRLCPPAPTGWIFSGISVLVLVGLCVLTSAFFSQFIVHVAGGRLERALAKSDRETAARYLEVVQQHYSSKRERFLGNSPPPEWMRAELIPEIFELNGNVIDNEPGRAIARYRELQKQGIHEPAEIPGLSLVLVNRLRALNDYFAEYSSAWIILRKTREELETMQAQRAQLMTRFRLIEQDLAEFFSLPLPQDDPGRAPAFYRSGVLAGFPALARLPDGIEDLVALRSELERAGGSVQVESENAHEEFNTKMSEMREGGHDIASQWDTTEARLEVLEPKSADQLARFHESRRKVLDSLRELVIGIVLPQ